MGVFTCSSEETSSISPARLFKALVLDSHSLLPKLMPQFVKSIEYLEGNGGAGSIRQVNFQEGYPVKYLKNRIEAFDPENFSYTYRLYEGVTDKLEAIVNEVQFLPNPNGGSINKLKSTFYTKDDIVLSEEEIKADKEQHMAMYKVVEAYLQQNPDLYT